MLNETTFKNNIVTWFEKNQREMPWRETTNPYYIWLSEVMLQQTQVKTVIDYYNKFIHRFPTIEALSEAKEESIGKVLDIIAVPAIFIQQLKKYIIIIMVKCHHPLKFLVN